MFHRSSRRHGLTVVLLVVVCALATLLRTATALQLFPYQLDGVERLRVGKRLLLGDEMGLGKSCQCIEAINRIGRTDATILIICPKTVLGVWQTELTKWLSPQMADALEVQVASTKTPPTLLPGSITLINYDICHKLRQIVQAPFYDVLICDEAHYLKSLDAKRTKIILGDARQIIDNPGIRSEYLWLLTGTPVLNRPVELFPLLHAIAPNEFPEFDDYANRYCDPKMKLVFARGLPMEIKDYTGSSNLKELAQRLEPIMLRRYKMDVLSQLPPKFRTCTLLTSTVDVGKRERKLLKQTLPPPSTTSKKVSAASLTTDLDLDDFGAKAEELIAYVGSDKSILAAISNVRQETAFLKLKPAIEILEDYISQEKVVVFAHHRAVIDDLTKHFGTRAVSIKGGMKRENRDEAVRRFQEDDSVRLFVGSIRAAGVGLTLTAASHVVFLELDWSPGVMTQAEDRCHRVGQSNSVRIQYFVFKDTIDEWLSRSLLFKQITINEILPEKLSGERTGYVFNFGKHEGIRLEDVPREYVQFLLKKEVWRNHLDLWRALNRMGLVLEALPPPPTRPSVQKTGKPPTQSPKSESATTKEKFDSQLAQNENTDANEQSVSQLLKKESVTTNERPAAQLPQKESANDNMENVRKQLKEVDYVFDFGKYRGKRWDDTPDNYRDWLLREKVWKSKGRTNLLEALTNAGFEPS